MAVPKKRTGASAQGHRRANWKATVPATTTCKKCGAIVPTHTVCPECGYYKEVAVSIKNENYKADAKAEAKKAPAKKATKKKAEKPAVEETVVEAQEVAVEEVKAEEVVEETTETVETEE
ncbi:MAG: 50S ribosomal protein L32 [Cyanobacteria bacterium SIG30]|nr:50S ribosomal protein L32 [Cyanobacteria bacterium SIG30]